jgi:hypothetical protein
MIFNFGAGGEGGVGFSLVAMEALQNHFIFYFLFPILTRFQQ